MAKGRKTNKRELLRDYRMFEKMSKDLLVHQKGVTQISRSIARGMKTDLRYGLIASLREIIEHMERAQKEIAEAKVELKRI